VILFAFLFFAAVVGGALNAVAGGGSFVALPALLYAGVGPVTANATTTMALWPGAVSSAIAYRREIKTTRQRLLILGAVSLTGGLFGALLLVRTSDSSFMRLLPWLMLIAAVTFTFGGRRQSGHQPLPLVAAMQLAIAIYGGYFGGGMGIMMLATLALAGMTDIHEMNGLKSILGAAINGVALIAFVMSGAVAWVPGLVMVGGGIVGGYAGASLARRVDRTHVRVFVTVVAWTMTAYFFLRG
jgi:uncharacterized membrane protein YfcA